jgi:uncharacterized membrane protein
MNSNGDLDKIEPVPNRNVLELNIKSRKLVKTSNKKMYKPRTKHTSLILTMACFLFLLAELPQFILLFLSLIKDKSFYDNVYVPLGGLIDLIIIVSSSTNCLIYCLMSSSYRETLFKLFGIKQKIYI